MSVGDPKKIGPDRQGHGRERLSDQPIELSGCPDMPTAVEKTAEMPSDGHGRIGRRVGSTVAYDGNSLMVSMTSACSASVMLLYKGNRISRSLMSSATGQSPTRPPNWRPIFDRCSGR